MTIRVLIVDDEPAARRGIRRHLSSHADVVVARECGNGGDAVAAIGELQPDLVFLDIEMPEVGGFDVVDAIGLAYMPATIFVTAYDEHALRAFDVHAVDYVLKPVDRERFRLALDRARLRIGTRADRGERIAAAMRELGRAAPPKYSRRLAVKSPTGIVLVDMRDVGHFASDGNYVEVHASGKTHLLRETLTALEARIDPSRFVRVSRSAIVCLDRICELRPAFNGDAILVLRDGTEIAASRRYRDRLDALLAG